MTRFLCLKSGATSVFLMMIMASLLILVGIFIKAAALEAGRSCADAVFQLAGRSILSEYCLPLESRYGIFAIHTNESEIEKKFRYYADFSFHDNPYKEISRGNSYTDLLRLETEAVDVSLKGYSVTDITLFERQVLDYMKTGIIGDNLTKKQHITKSDNDIELRNKKVINSLPSFGYQNNIFIDFKGLIDNGISSPDVIMKKGGSTYLVDEYIIGHFKHHGSDNGIRDSFFTNEIEYILKGNFNDNKNYRDVRSDIFIMRNLSNLMHITSDPEKRKKVEAVAAALSLGEGEPVAAVAVAEAWAAAEAENDIRLLEDGKKVSLIKTSDHWAVPISDTLKYLWNDGYITPDNLNGLDYEDYLRILLYLEDREKKLLRCMDLIQINMKGCYDREFDLKEYYGGFHIEATVNGTRFTYDQKF